MSSESWQLSSDAAVLYERYVHPLMAPWVEALVERAQLSEGDRVLDVACGTGFVSRLAVKKVGKSGQVTGSDLNSGMIAAAREISEKRDSVSIDWCEADVQKLPFDDACFEAVLCQQGMQFFPDIAASVKELHRVLVPGGRLVFTIWSPIEENPYFYALAKALETHLSEQAANGLRGAFAKSYSGNFSSSIEGNKFKQITIDTPALNFTLPPLDEYLLGHLASLPMADAIAALPDSKKIAMLTDVSNDLKEFTTDTGLAIPTRCELVSAVA